MQKLVSVRSLSRILFRLGLPLLLGDRGTILDLPDVVVGDEP